MKKKSAVLFMTGMLLFSSCNSIEEKETLTVDYGIELTETKKANEAEKIPLFIDEEEQETEEIPEQPENEAETEAESGTAVISFGGDVTQSDVFGEATLARNITYPLEDVSEIFSSADIAFLNLESDSSNK